MIMAVMCKCPKCDTAFRAEVVPVHFVPSSKGAVCGVALTREVAVSGNPRRITCCRCLKTSAYKSALAGLRRHKNGERKFTQPSLF